MVVPVMRYHSILVEEMPEGFSDSSFDDSQATMEFNTKTCRFMACSIIEEVSERQMAFVFYSDFIGRL